MSLKATGLRAALGIGLLLASALDPVLVPTARAAVRIDAGGGTWLPFDQDQRRVFGTSPAISAGVSVSIGSGVTLAFLEAAYSRGTGSEYGDATFEADSEYDLVPVSFGLRFRAAGEADARMALLLGVAWQTVFTTWERPFLPAERTPTYGLRLELRPECRLGDRWILWLRQHLSFLAETRSVGRTVVIDPSGGGLEIGLGFEAR